MSNEDSLRERLHITIADKMVILEPVSSSTYQLEIAGKSVKQYSANRPPLATAGKDLSAYFDRQTIDKAIKAYGWQSSFVDIFDLGGQ